jgi:hypothetical protein
MDKVEFWKLIDASRKTANGDAQAQVETLRKLLTALAPDALVAFDRLMSQYHARAFNWGLWGAAFIIGGGCSDDGFLDFRGWLISRGEKAYEDALRNPETLINVVKVDEEDCQVEGFQSVAGDVWEEKTCQSSDDFPRHDIERHVKPTGAAWEEDDLEKRFPKLCKTFY